MFRHTLHATTVPCIAETFVAMVALYIIVHYDTSAGK